MKTKLLKILIVALVFLGLIQVVSSCYLADQGHQLKLIEQQSLDLEAENRRVQKQVADFISLAKVKTEAEAQGFINNPQVLDLTSLPAVALKP